MSVDVIPSPLTVVTGTVTANLGATDNAVLDTIASPVATISSTPLQRVAIFDGSDTQITSFGGGTQYTEGDTDATITGTAMLWEDTGNTLRAVSVSKPLPIDHSITALGDGVKTVTSAGTDEALAGSTVCKKVIIQAQTDNGGLIAVGASGVDATEATGTGILLEAGDIVAMNVDNLADVFVDATVSGEGVRYSYFV